MGVKTRKLGNINDSLIQWQAVVVADGSTGLTAVAGRGYFINTTSATQTVTLPASPAIGDTISIVDYASTFATNNVTINPNGNKIEADTANGSLQTNDQTHTLVYTDSTQGWKIVNQDTAASIQPEFTAATGGTVTTSGDFKIHSFTGDGNFVVSQVGTLGNPTTVEYLVVAGGGGGGNTRNFSCTAAGGGGAGGYRTNYPSPGLAISATTYPITVGSGGNSNGGIDQRGNQGSNSVFSTITSTGGGGGGSSGPGQRGGGSGGSGGGKTDDGSPGAGNTPPVSPPQGNSGGNSSNGGGGGGASAAGSDAPGDGGAGSPNSITGSAVTYAGGGGSGQSGSGTPRGATNGSGGAGGGGVGSAGSGFDGGNGTANTGGGAGGGAVAPGTSGGTGGKGVVIIRYKYQ